MSKASIIGAGESVICDQGRVFTACSILNGDYGYSDIYLGVPVILGKNGVECVIELKLEEDDKERFELSQQEVRRVFTTY